MMRTSGRGYRVPDGYNPSGSSFRLRVIDHSVLPALGDPHGMLQTLIKMLLVLLALFHVSEFDQRIVESRQQLERKPVVELGRIELIPEPWSAWQAVVAGNQHRPRNLHEGRIHGCVARGVTR